MMKQDDVYAVLNFINPSFAPTDPTHPIPYATGDENIPEDLLIARTKLVRNARVQNFKLGRDGFELLNTSCSIPSSVVTNKDYKLLYKVAKETFVPLAYRLLHEELGIDNCFACYLTPPYLRKAGTSGIREEDHNHGNTPHSMAHNDYAFDYLKHLHSLEPHEIFGLKNPKVGQKLVEDYRKANRVIVLQFWQSAQPEGTVIENNTLAVCHPRSVERNDLISRPLKSYAGEKIYHGFNTLQPKDSPNHEWYYFPNMTTNECLCWLGHDSAWKDSPKPSFHSSFQNPTAPRNARPRESLECRVVCLIDESNSKRVCSRL